MGGELLFPYCKFWLTFNRSGVIKNYIRKKTFKISRFQRKYHNILTYSGLMLFKAFFNGLQLGRGLLLEDFLHLDFSRGFLFGGQGLINGEVVLTEFYGFWSIILFQCLSFLFNITFILLFRSIFQVWKQESGLGGEKRSGSGKRMILNDGQVEIVRKHYLFKRK